MKTGLLWRMTAIPLLLFLILPILLLFLRTTPASFFASLAREEVHHAILVSFRTTLVSLFLVILFGTPLAFLMGRVPFRLKRLVDALIDLPTLLPPSVAGVALLLTFGRQGPIGGWLESLGVQIAFTAWAVVLAQVFVAAPLYIRSASIGFSTIETEIEQAAQLDGAGRWQILRYVILPLSRFALINGSMLSWARALGEFGATIIFAGNFPGRTQTMPTAIYLGFQLDLDLSITLSVILVAFSLGAILLVKELVSRQAG